MLKFDFSPHAQVFWEEDVSAARVVWLKMFMTIDDFKAIIENGLGMAKANKSKIWIADSYESQGVFPKDVQAYMHQDDLAQEWKTSGIEKILTVMPKSTGLSSISTKAWTKKVEEEGFYKMDTFPDLESCKKWIKEFMP